MSVALHGLSYPSLRRRRTRAQAIVGDESEAHFMGRIRTLARLYGWQDWHQLSSLGTRPGYPDLHLLRPPRSIFAELKSEHGHLTRVQRETLALLTACGHEAYAWKPSDLPSIVRILR
jgi:hypothetical protein